MNPPLETCLRRLHTLDHLIPPFDMSYAINTRITDIFNIKICYTLVTKLTYTLKKKVMNKSHIKIIGNI